MMASVKKILVVLALGVSMAAMAPQFSWSAVARSLPTDYRTVFQQKSIFSRERFFGADNGDGFTRGRFGRQPTAFPPVFVGVIDAGGQSYASMEEPRSGEVTLYAVGSTLPQNYGRIEAINLDFVMVRSTNGLRQIKLGQNVSGGSRPSTDDIEAADLANGPLVPSTPPPGSPAAGGSTGGGPADDAVAKLIAKRRAELQGTSKPPGGTP